MSAASLLLLLLAWMSLRAFNGESEQFSRVLDELDRLETVQTTLQRDVLSARAGILRSYDPLVSEARELRGSIARLREMVAPNSIAEAITQRLNRALSQQDGLVEEFKTNNALLQNSLSYFARFTSRIDPAVDGGSFAKTVSAVVAAVLRLTLDTSAASTGNVRERLSELASEPDQNDPKMANAILAHGRLLDDLLPATDRVLTELSASTIQRDLDQFRLAIMAHQAREQVVARQSRLVLYLLSPLLVGLLAYVGRALGERARTLRCRAAFARVIANSSIYFVAATDEELDGAISRALGEMAACLGAERAYFIESSTSPASYTWCAPGVSFPPGWPDGALSLVSRIGRAVPNGVAADVPYARRLSSREHREALRAACLRSWACASRIDEGGNQLLLGFDAVTATKRIGLGGELLQIGLNAIATALEHRGLEQARARLEARLQQARRLETIGVFASGITHNLNNMLGAILGYAEMAGEQDTDGRHYPNVLGQIRSAGQRARDLVEQILAFARRRDPQPRRASLRKLIDESASLLRASLSDRVELAVGDTADAVVLGEPGQLQQVILNLVNNAAQAMSNTGRVELRTETHVLTGARSLSHGLLAPGSYVCILVSDHGSGIDPAMQERIFEPFFTTKWSGSGLGLATAREIVAEHGGALHVESTVGVGSRFEVWLPLAGAAEPAADIEVEGARIGRGETVLVLERDRERLLRAEEILAALGFEPVGYHQAAEAETAFRDAPERFDVVVIGHLGAAATALRLAASLRDAAPSLPLLLATPSADKLGAHTLASAGVSDVIRWPIVAAEVAASIRDCLGRSRRHSLAHRLTAETVR